MKRLSFEELIERKASSRFSRDERNAAKQEKREEMALRMIGELGSGKHYIYPVGGQYREGTRSELVSFLIRNHYV